MKNEQCCTCCNFKSYAFFSSIQICGLTGRQTDGQTGRQESRQKDIHLDRLMH
jgi:hypothetical protein